MITSWIKNKRSIFMLASVSLLVMGFLFAPIEVGAQSARDAACEGVQLTGGSCDGGTADRTVNGTIKTVIDLLSVVVGFIAVIMIIVGGLKYIISSGDSGNVNSAKNTILYAIVGLVIVALAQVIVRFVLNQVD